MAKEEKKEESSYMVAIDRFTIRGIVQAANDLEIKREQIVSLVKQGEQYVLVYYT